LPYTEWARGIFDVDRVFDGIRKRQIAPIFAETLFPQVVNPKNVDDVVMRLGNEFGTRYVESLHGLVDGIDLNADYHGERYECMSFVENGILTPEFREGVLILRRYFADKASKPDESP
jgi:hypothetical protein